MKVGKPQLMREWNLQQIRQLLQEHDSLTKPELSVLSGLSVVTINALVKQLSEYGEIQQLKESSATGGRPATRFRYNFDYQYVFAICLFQREQLDMIELTICNLAGEVKEQWQITCEVTQECLAELIEDSLVKFPTIKQVALGIPGVEIDGEIKLCDFIKLRQTFLRRYLMTRTGLPVVIENDVNSVLLGYCHQKAIRDQTVVVLYYPDNYAPGSAIFLFNQIYHGANGLVGEINQLPLSTSWHEMTSTEETLPVNLLETLVTMMILYDPHQFVIYGNRINKKTVVSVRHQLMARFQGIELPEIQLLTSFNEDYLTGVKSLGIQQLQTE